MKHIAIKVIGRIVLGMISAVVISGNALADEKTGNLVFNAMEKLQKTHQAFQGDVGEFKAERKAAAADLDIVRKKYKKAGAGTLNKQEFHARFSYAQARLYRAVYDEAKLTNQVAGKQLRILNKLNASVMSGEAGTNAKGVALIIKSAKPFLKNSNSLLISLAQYRHKINDPDIDRKLQAAYGTAQMLSKYVKQKEKGGINRDASSQKMIKRKLAGLIEQLKALYVQTDIYMSMLKDKSTALKMTNEVAAAEAAVWALSDGNKIVTQLSENVMLPLMDILDESDEDLDLLVEGVSDGSGNYQSPVGAPKWTHPNL